MKKFYSDEELLNTIQQFFDEYNRVPKIKELAVSKETFRLRFGSYTNAIKLLNLPVNRRTSDMLSSSCAHCGNAFTSYDKEQIYCSHSCRAQVTNKTRKLTPTPPQHECPICGKLHNNSIFCSIECSRTHNTNLFNSGLLISRPSLRKQLGASACMECGLSEWRGEALPLELDHIDGDASNNLPTNLRMICANCHSITTTWKARNKGSGRKARGLPLS